MSNDQRSRSPLRGFSLIELMIIVVITGILASIALQVFQYHKLRSRTTEVATHIYAITQSQRTFKAASDNFANVTVFDGNTGLLPTGVAWAGAPCDPACAPANPGLCNQFSCIGFRVVGRVLYEYASPASPAAAGVPSEFCVSARGDLDGDGLPGEYEYQSDEGQTGVGVLDCPNTACPPGIEAWETMNCDVNEF